jgi:hypothetical protein
MLGDIYFPLPPSGTTAANLKRRRRYWRPTLLRVAPSFVRSKRGPFPFHSVIPTSLGDIITTQVFLSQNSLLPNQPLAQSRYRR